MKKIIYKIIERFKRISLPEYTTFSFFAVLMGVTAGLAAVIFHNSIHFFNDLFFEQTKEGLYFLGAAAVIVLPALGMFIQSIMIYSAPEISKKRGVAEVIKAVALRGGYIPFRTTLFHFFAPVICIGSGGTVGPEGPAAQLGGGVTSKIGSLLKLSDSKRRMFTAAGAGAAIAAIFNTPLGGIFFALEIVLLNDFQTPTFSALILASVTASAISRIFLGDTSIFIFADPEIGSYANLYLFAILGVFTGLLSLSFIKYSGFIEKTFNKNILKKMPRWLVMTLVGILVGVCGYFYKDIFGIGYNGINHILSNQFTWQVAAILLVMKFVLVPLVLYSGGFGGMFAPSLFMGACFGYLFTFFANKFFGLNLDPTTFVLVSMGAMLGGINSIPISSILIIFEMTKDYSFILPLMLAVVISTTLVQLKLHGSIHVKHLEQQGFNISNGRETSILRSILVENVMRKDVLLIPENTTLPELVSKLIGSPSTTFYLVNKDGNLSGRITESELRPIILEYEQLKSVIVASDIASKKVIMVKTDDHLDYVMNILGKVKIDELPVIDSVEKKQIVGTISRHDVISAYNRESLKFNLAGGFAKELRTIDESRAEKVAEGFSIVERKVPTEFVGKSIYQLRLRNDYGLEILMIKKAMSVLDLDSENRDVRIPDPDYVIKENDTLVLFGKDENIEKTAKWG